MIRGVRGDNKSMKLKKRGKGEIKGQRNIGKTETKRDKRKLVRKEETGRNRKKEGREERKQEISKYYFSFPKLSYFHAKALN
jgi:hypothetical protein